MTTADSVEQIKAIHSMLESGHKSIKLERHTLALWGITVALLVIIIEWTFRAPFYFYWIASDWLERQFQKVALVAATLGTVIFLDTKLTVLARKKRDQSVSFIQQRLQYIYWMMAILFVLFVLGTLFFGGEGMIYGVGIILVGMAFFIHGLFSQQMLLWSGFLIILSGIFCVFFNSPLTQMCLTLSVFGIGFPLLGWMISQNWDTSLGKSIASSLIWVLMIALSTWTLNTFFGYREHSDIQIVSYDDYRQGKVDGGEFLVNISAGTTIPIGVELKTNLTNFPARARMELKLAKDVQLAVNENKEIFYKFDNGSWFNKNWHEDKTPKIYGFFIDRYFTFGEIYMRYDF